MEDSSGVANMDTRVSTHREENTGITCLKSHALKYKAELKPTAEELKFCCRDSKLQVILTDCKMITTTISSERQYFNTI